MGDTLVRGHCDISGRCLIQAHLVTLSVTCVDKLDSCLSICPGHSNNMFEVTPCSHYVFHVLSHSPSTPLPTPGRWTLLQLAALPYQYGILILCYRMYLSVLVLIKHWLMPIIYKHVHNLQYFVSSVHKKDNLPDFTNF